MPSRQTSGGQSGLSAEDPIARFMASPDYRRVSRKRLCRVCGKPDWCSYTPDEKISFCARVVKSADRVSRTGWGVFYHEKSLIPSEPFPFPRHRQPAAKKVELAPLEIRDFAYRKLIRLAPAIDSKEIIDGAKGLRARKIMDFENYGGLPQSRGERREIAREIRALINRQFPDYVRKQKSAVSGLPGFWLDKSGKVQLWSDKDYSNPMLLIPYRAANGLIQACQIRFMGNQQKNRLRYVWLSAPEKSGGVSSGSPLHFVRQFAADSGKTILVTEGALKAETAQISQPELKVIAVCCVSCSHEAVIQTSRFRPLLIAFDSDYHENRQVVRQLANLLQARLSDSRIHGYDSDVKILVWSRRVKGIDDALLQSVPIISVSPSDWFKSLSGVCQREIAGVLPFSLAN